MTPDATDRPAPTPRTRDALLAYQAAAWRPPGATRFDSRPANDFLARADAIVPRTLSARRIEPEPLPPWVVATVGAVVAAGLGAVLGAMMSV